MTRATQSAKDRDDALHDALRAGGFVAFDADVRSGHVVLSDTANGASSAVSGPQERFLRHLVGEDRAVIREVVRSIQATGNAQGAEVRYAREDGNITWLRVSMRAAQRENGEVITISGLITELAERGEGADLIDLQVPNRSPVRTYADFTAREKLKLELRDREELYRALVEASSAGVWRATPEGSIIEGSGWQPFWKQGTKAFEGYSWLDTVHPDDKSSIIAIWDESNRDRKPARYEYRVRQPDGGYRWALAKAVPLLNADGEIREWVGTLSEIHDRKETEATLILRERSLEAIAQGVVITDAGLPDHPIIYSNSAFETLTGYSAGEAYGRNCRFLQGPETDPRVAARIHSALKAERSIQTTITNHRKDGTSFINELTISPVQSATGVTTHFVGTLSDITERSRLNETLRLALRAGHMVAWEHDLRTDFVTRSDNARELVGIGSGTLSDFLARVHPDDQPVRARLVEDVDRDGVGTCEFRCILPGGEIMWFGCRAEKVGPDRIAGVSYDITTRKAAEDDLWRAANRDFMTGLPNRSLFQQSLEQAVGQARRNGTSISLLLIDLDNFKDINDTLGHDAGDALLAELATRLDVLQKDGDMVARIGGDEFAVLVVAPVSFETVIRLAETVKERVRMPFVFGGRTFVTRASVGVAGFPSDAVSPAELMKAADIALYQAKAQGRSRIVAYASSMRLEIEARVALAAEIRDAISRDQIVPYYQPKVSLLTGRVTGFEALARWQHPDKGLLTPQYFGTIFSDHNLAAAIGRCVLTQVARDIRRWLDDGLDPGRGAINLSSAEFNNPRLATDLLAVLDHWRVPVENFEVEVTETVLLGRETENVAAILTQFHQRGVQIALDDFGTGYASLTHLKRFPVDHIKIDQSFIRDMEADASNDAIVAAVIGLCRSLNLQVTAEGIETEGQSRRLRELGCTNAQGYFYAKPMSGARVAGFLSTWMSDLHGRPLPSPWIHPSSG